MEELSEITLVYMLQARLHLTGSGQFAGHAQTRTLHWCAY